MKTPQIKSAPDEDFHDFHDSSLIDIWMHPSLSRVSIVTSTPDEFEIQHLWQIDFLGVLRVEYEITGDGTFVEDEPPIEIYDIYLDRESEEYVRWNERARHIGIREGVHHVVLASGFACGWGEKRGRLEGITIVCRGWEIQPAPSRYKGMEFTIPKIPAADE